MIIFISHRPHSLQKVADEICILDGGKIILSGNHENLMQTRNFYSDFFS